MAQIHRKRPLIVKRIGTWHKKGSKEEKPKKKSVHIERIKEGAKIIGGGLWSGLKKAGAAYEKYQEPANRIGSISSEFFSLPGYDEPRRKKKSKKRR